MSKKFLVAVSVLSAILVATAAVFVAAPSVTITKETLNSGSNAVINVAEKENCTVDAGKVLESRFLNMLNHNFVYNDAIGSVEQIVNDSTVALLEYRDLEDESYIAENFVTDYVYNMYGVEIENFAEINADFPQKDGFVYIIPRGFAIYEHETVSITLNEDGSYTVKTNVTVSSHDSESYADICETLFVENADSQFGYNIVYSRIGAQTVAM